MPNLNFKNIFLVVFVVILLAYSRWIYAVVSKIWDWFVIGLSPLDNTPPGMRYIVTILLMAFIFVFIYQTFINRRK